MFTETEPVRVDLRGIRTGGTLRLRGPGDPAALDPSRVDDVASARLTRLYARQLFTYRAEPDVRSWQAIAPVPDLAARIPSIYNAGLGASGTTYVVHLRPGARWDTGRPVTAHDVVRGMKRLASPVRPPSVLPYFTSTVRGMARFHAEFVAAAGTDPTAADLAAFQDSHEIAGVFALDDESLVFELVRPTLDFISMLALPAVAPAPAEYDAYLPDSPELRQHLRASGPYRVASYEPGRELVLEPNPAWRQDTDPVRRRHLDRIEVGLGAAPDPVELAGRLRTGEVDLAWGVRVAEPHPGRPAEPTTGLGWSLDPYLAFNPRGDGPPRDPAVRQAIGYAIDKAALADVVVASRTGTAVRVAGGIVPPHNDFHAGADPYPTPGGRGLPERARELLAGSGHPDGLTLTAIHSDPPEAAAVARSIAADLSRVGVTLRLVPLPPARHRARVADPSGEWDLTVLSLAPDWFHGNARVFAQRLAHGLAGYLDPEVDRLVERALDSLDPRRAAPLWQEVERRVLADLPVVPLLFQTPAVPPLRGPRVRGAVPLPTLGFDDDLSTVWLDAPH
ncbi:ABC transporter substrate-binding protein [Phytohabitans suffuscus]|uniref:ABC transporter substrate-binding protein n=1 Tax=Phytohabitans suffuscus TaxID=624315 RepID=A0A6F8YRA3_9ACTN|nr:ABC transporter substrate-binding protein [Phytohabitans suffuscus]BCB88523.1 ABC transporter substrate-binding protein [Phytohabitans suffuscus]